MELESTEATGRIQIIKTPKGEMPLELRLAWVGLILPCHPYLGYSDKGDGQCGFSVPQDEAIAILKKTRPGAATCWEIEGYPKEGEYFGFAEDEAKIISGVTRQRIVEVTEEMQGQTSR